MDKSPVNYSATPVNEEDLMLWQAVVLGPNNTEYENGTFFLRVQFPLDYPFKPPRVHFVTPILHTNIDSRGRLNLDILKDQWSPALNISKLLLCIHSMLSEPNPDDPLVPDLARLYKRDRKKYEITVKEHARKHAIQNYGRYSLISNYSQPSKVYTLMGLCRKEIRNCIWRKSTMVNTGIKSLSVPTRIKNYLMYADGLLEQTLIKSTDQQCEV